MSFSDPLMLAGLLAALVPVLLHLLNRVHAPVVPFPTLRFLKLTAEKTARRRHIQQYFLLLVRVIVFAMIAMAVAAPLIRGGSAGLAYGFVAMMIGGLALLVLSGVWSAAAIDRARARREPPPPPAAAAPLPAAAARAEPHKPRGVAAFWGLSLAALVAALALAGFSVYGLVSDRFFSAQTGEYSGQSTAMAIIFDNSPSMLARSGSGTKLSKAREQVRQLLGEALRPAEAAVLPTNPGEQAASMPLTRDTTRLVGYLDNLEPRGRTFPMQERIRLGVELLERSRQPNHLLVIVSDFARPAFADPSVFAGIRASGSPGSLQVVLMPIGGSADPAAAAADLRDEADVGIVSFKLAEGSERPAVGTQMTFEAELINNGDAADVRDFTLTVDGKPLDGMTTRVALGAAGLSGARTVLKIPYRLKLPGPHRYGLMLGDAGPNGKGSDALAWDDQRELVLDAAEQVKVLVVGAEPAPRTRTAAFYMMAALAPFGEGEAVPWSIRPTYRPLAELERDAAGIGAFGAVFLCDLPQVDARLSDALVRYARNGGRLVWILGPGIDARAYNDGPGARGLLPGKLAAPIVAATASPIDWAELRSGPLANLFDSQEPFRSLLVTGRWTLEGESRGRPLAKLADGTPVMIEHSPGNEPGSAGTIYTLMTTPGSAWSNLGATVLLVPLASRMALGDARQAEGQFSFETGDLVPIHRSRELTGQLDAAAAAKSSVDVTMPGGGVLNVHGQLVTETPRWPFDRTLDPGLYQWRSSEGKDAGMFVVNPPGDEADLFPSDVEALARLSTPGDGGGAAVAGGPPAIVAAGAPDLLAQLGKRSEGTSLLPGFVSMVLILAIVEALMANRHRAPAA